jgi:arabinose-5-phosphate isomerase
MSQTPSSQTPSLASARPHAATRSALRTLGLERAGIAALEAALTADGALAHAFDEAVAIMTSATGRVIITGMGKSGHIARKLAATFASTGTPSHFVHPAEASHGDLGMVQSGDVILALSWSGETAELADIITFTRRFQISLIAITSNADSALGREADICLALPHAEEACPNGLAPTTSTTMQLAMGDALAIALLEARGFTAHDFRLFHPGGKLGARLSFVRDIMHKDDALPVVRMGTSMDHALLEMTSKRLGCVAVADQAGKLAGIITDGDLRRHMANNKNFLAHNVEDIMTPAPLTIAPDTMAAEALAILSEKKRTVLIVTDHTNTPIGMVHVHDLYQIGLA